VKRNDLVKRSLLFYLRGHFFLALSAATGVAVLVGALIVGDSMRGSLRTQALQRLGPVSIAVQAGRYVGEDLAERMEFPDGANITREKIAAGIMLAGGVEHAATRARSNRVSIIGIDDQWRDLFPDAASIPSSGNNAAVNQTLAQQLKINEGDDVLLRLAAQSDIPAESLLGRPESASRTARLRVTKILPDDGMGGFSLAGTHTAPFNVLLPLATLQRIVEQEKSVNTLVMATGQASDADVTAARAVRDALKQAATLRDYGVRLRIDETLGVLALEAESLLLEPTVEQAARDAANELQLRQVPVITYLANSICNARCDDDDKSAIPYSMVAGMDIAERAALDGNEAAELATDEIALNQWAADELNAQIGDEIELEYYVSERFGALRTESATFKLKQIVPLEGWAADPNLMPAYPGISDAKTLGEWDPPPSYKIDLSRIRPQDEAYWEQRKGTPKAFITLETAQQRFVGTGRRFGELTAIYYAPQQGLSLDETRTALSTALLQRLNPEQMALVVRDVRAAALNAAAGSTDFSGLFIAFSFFAIFSALLLVALSFRLTIERRARQVGLLYALGFDEKSLRKLLTTEGLWVGAIGTFVGIPLGIGYAYLMIAGLRTLWAGAVQAPFLRVFVEPLTLVIGAISGLLITWLTLRLALRGLTKQSPRALLAGRVDIGGGDSKTRSRRAALIAIALLVVGVGIIAIAITSDALSATIAFFIGGFALLGAGLAWMAHRIGRGRVRSGVLKNGTRGFAAVGIGNIARHRGRSLSTVALIAFATFVIIAVGASRHGASGAALATGAGGYRLLGQAAAPMVYSLATAEGRENLTLSQQADRMLADAQIAMMRRKPGDDASCLNLYAVQRPVILGVDDEFIERGGFSFTGAMSGDDVEAANPWQLLQRDFDDGAIPAIGDMNTLMWLLKLGIGDDLKIIDENGSEQSLRIVGMLSGSVLQSQLIIAEDHFVELFSSINGYDTMLIDVQAEQAESLAVALEDDLTDYGLDIESTLEVLDRYRAVENTYMSAFQSIGGLGLLIGTLGLGAVMLRNVNERRGELALLRALGCSGRMVGVMVLSENVILLIAGIGIGTASALVATLPNALSTAAQIDWPALGLTVAAVLLTGLLANIFAVRAALQARIIGALRSE